MMDNFFMEVKDSTGIELQVSYNQWQTRKRAWDEEWSIKERAGLSPKAQGDLDKLPLWFDSNNGIITHKYLELGKSSWFERPTKVKVPMQISEYPECWYHPNQRDMDETWNNNVPVYGSISDSTNPNFGYTDAPHTAPFFNYEIDLDQKRSPYDFHHPAEQALTNYDRQALAPNALQAHYNNKNITTNTSLPTQPPKPTPSTTHFDATQVSGFEHHTTVFNEHVLHCDALAAVELTHSSHSKARKPSSNTNAFPQSSPLAHLPLETTASLQEALEYRSLVPYGERR